MPGKLFDTNPGPLASALEVLASAYTNSDEELENEGVDVEINTKENVETLPDCENGNGSGTSSSTIIPNSQEVRSAVKPEECVQEISAEEQCEEATTSEQISVQEVNTLIRGQGQGLDKESVGADNEGIEIISIIDYNAQPFTSAQNTEKDTKSDSETSDSDLDSDSDYSEDEDSGDGTKSGRIRQPPRVKGELLLSDLPPIEDLHISVPHEQCEAIGTIKSIVDSLVVIESYLNSAALNLETVLFMEEGDQTLGHIFDVFGPVKQPHYCVRFNSKEHMSTRGVEIGKLVYCAPKTEHTSYVLMGQLKNLRGTDASWQDDIEPPLEELDFSDDEAERVGKKGGRKNPVNPDNPNQINVSSRSPGFPGRGRGRKRCANYDNVEMMQQAYGVYNQSSPGYGNPNIQSPFNPPFVSGFYPPSMRFRGLGPRPFVPSYARGFNPHRISPSPPRTYFVPGHLPQPPPYHPMQNPHFQGQTANNGSSFNNYDPPPPPPGLGQTARYTPQGDRPSFNYFDPPPPPPPPRVEYPRVPQRQYY